MVFPKICLNDQTYKPLPLLSLGGKIVFEQHMKKSENEIKSICHMFMSYYTGLQMLAVENYSRMGQQVFGIFPHLDGQIPLVIILPIHIFETTTFCYL